MDTESKIDIWFGPGGLYGAFGAGVARGLHLATEQGDLNLKGTRLYGSSVGCLIACYLATGNTDCGLNIFREDARSLFSIAKLPQLMIAGGVNQIGKRMGSQRPVLNGARVLDVDQAIDVMFQRTPDIVDEIRCSRTPVFAEYVDLETRQFCHQDLRVAEDPVRWINASLNMVPFTGKTQTRFVDSNAKGYGFTELIDQLPDRRIVLVLNFAPRFNWIHAFCSHLCSISCADEEVRQLYVGRAVNCRNAIKLAMGDRRILIVSRPKNSRKVDQAFNDGVESARKVVDFIVDSD